MWKIFNSVNAFLLPVTRGKPAVYAWAYIVNIILFALLYAFFFNKDFRTEVGLLESAYFSVVTVTTLGYGDITPKLTAHFLLFMIIIQVVMGVITIGLFLNSLSQKLSDLKDEEQRERNRIEEKELLKKLMTILKPIVISHLEVLSETYKVTASKEGGSYKIAPSQLFNQDYYDQICLQNFYSNATRYGTGKMLWAKFLAQENESFINKLDDFLIKFTSKLPIEYVEYIIAIQNHNYLKMPNQALSLKRHAEEIRMPSILLDSYLSLEHSSVKIEQKPKIISDYHEKLLKLIDAIEYNLPDIKIEMNLHLMNGMAPKVGSAIGRIMKLGPTQES